MFLVPAPACHRPHRPPPSTRLRKWLAQVECRPVVCFLPATHNSRLSLGSSTCASPFQASSLALHATDNLLRHLPAPIFTFVTLVQFTTVALSSPSSITSPNLTSHFSNQHLWKLLLKHIRFALPLRILFQRIPAPRDPNYA